MKSKRLLKLFGVIGLAAALLMVGCAPKEETVLEKIQRTGEITIGHREGAVPFGFYDEAGNWVGFSMDLGELLVKQLEKDLGIDINYIKKPVNPKTRIPLVANRTIDIVMGCTTRTVPRDDVVDFSLTFFATGARLLVPKGSDIKTFADLAGKKCGAATGATANIRGLEEANASGEINPPCELVLFEEHAKAFLGLQQGKIDAHCTDASLLAGMKQAAPDPENWEIVGRLLTYEPLAFIVPENDSNWVDYVNTFLIRLIQSGEFYEVYDKWMGPNGEVPIPMTDEYKTLLKMQCFPW